MNTLHKGYNIKRIYIIFVLSIFFLIGCVTSSVYVDISHNRYIPRFQTEKYSEYKGKKLFLSSIINNADNTSVFYYFSPDSDIKYGEYAISSYLWYCFNKAFNSVGMTIYQDTAPSDIPEFLFEFDDLTDQKISFLITVNKHAQMSYQKKYIIKFPAPESKDIPYLENRAYEMVDIIITTILNDRTFAAVL